MSKKVTRAGLFGPAAPVALAGWDVMGQPGNAAGALVLCAVALLTVPLVLMSLLLAPAALAGLLVPHKWRKAHRRRHGREHCKSAYIGKRLRRAVLAADRHGCVMNDEDCSGPAQVDHVRPWSQGGLTSLFNLMTLCRYHNVPVKSNYWPGAYYRGDDIEGARRVLATERVARLNPARWLRAAWSM